MLYVIMSNMGGELERREAADEDAAKKVLLELIEECGFLADGDIFTIVEADGE